MTLPLVALVDVSARMGGVEFSTLYLAQSLSAERFRRLVVCPTEGDLPRRCRELGIPMVIVPRPHLFATRIRVGERYVVNPVAWLVNLVLLIVAAQWLTRGLRDRQVDLVCTKGLLAHFYGGLAARRLSIPCVWHIQDLVSTRAGNLYAAALGRVGQWLAQALIVDGNSIAEQLAPYVRPGQITVIANGVDTDQFSPEVDGQAVRREWSVSDRQVVIGNVARLTPWKGQASLIRAVGQVLAEFPDARLVLVGSPVFDTDAYEQALHQQVREAGLDGQVIFAGYRWDLPQVMAALDVFVSSSIDKDTTPLAVVSAMAAGKAIVATGVAGVAELFGNEPAAILVTPADDEVLAGGLREVLTQPLRRRALGQAARARAVRELSLTQFARKCEDVFRQALTA